MRAAVVPHSGAEGAELAASGAPLAAADGLEDAGLEVALLGAAEGLVGAVGAAATTVGEPTGGEDDAAIIGEATGDPAGEATALALVTGELAGDFAAVGAHACAGACAVVVVVSHPGATALARSAGDGLGLGEVTAAARLAAGDAAADALALGDPLVALAAA
jgi:hypothetical protein